MSIKLKLFFAAMISVFVIGCAAAAGDRVRSGEIDFDRFKAFAEAESEVDVVVDGWLMSLARVAAAASEEPETEWLSGVNSIRVKVFPLRGEQRGEIGEIATQLGAELDAQGWQRVIKVVEDDEYVTVHVLGDERQLSGVTVMVLDDDDEAVFINIHGRIDADQIGAILSQQRIAGVKLDISPSLF